MMRTRPSSPRSPRSPRPPVLPDRELAITGRVAGGAGLARDGERVLLVSGAAPGDRVLARVEGQQARVLRVLSPGPDRVSPPCPVVHACGGCDWMHLSIEAQRREHAIVVRRAIAHALGVDAERLPALQVHPAARELGYRTRARLGVQAAGRGAQIGYRVAGSRGLVAIAACPVLDPRLEAALVPLTKALAGSRGEGDAQIALGRVGGDPAPVIELTWRGELGPGFFRAIDESVSGGSWAGLRVTMEGAREPATFGDPRPILRGFDGADVVVDPGGFAQASDEGAAMIARRVGELAEPADRRVVELFAGSGTLSIALAPGARSFVGVEASEPAVRAGRENLAARGLQGKMVVADAERYPLPKEIDVLVLDPPRTGAREASRAIARARPRRVLYVSCDPATLARDLAELCGGPGAGAGGPAAGGGPFELEAIETFEMFPQTSHVETLVALRRARRSGA